MDMVCKSYLLTEHQPLLPDNQLKSISSCCKLSFRKQETWFSLCN